MTLVLDAGALIAADRGDRDLVTVLKRELLQGQTVRTHGGIVGQVWRNGSRQARLAKLLRSLDVVGLDEELGRQAGALMARSGTSDVIDAALVAIAHDGDEIFTSDLSDIAVLAEAAMLSVDLIPV